MRNENTPGAATTSANQVWFVDAAACGDGLRAWQDQAHALDAATKARLAAIKHDDERTTRFAVHCALRVLIEQIAGPGLRGTPLTYTPKGQPALEGLGLSLSLSHTHGAGLIALSSASTVGVDMEPRSRRIKMQPERQRAIIAAAAALNQVARGDQAVPLTFLPAWVRLEAYGKATGEGLAPLLTEALAPLRTITTLGKTPQPIESGARDQHGGALAVTDLEVPANFVAALALPSADARSNPHPEVRAFPTTVSGLSKLCPPSSR